MLQFLQLLHEIFLDLLLLWLQLLLVQLQLLLVQLQLFLLHPPAPAISVAWLELAQLLLPVVSVGWLVLAQLPFLHDMLLFFQDVLLLQLGLLLKAKELQLDLLLLPRPLPHLLPALQLLPAPALHAVHDMRLRVSRASPAPTPEHFQSSLPNISVFLSTELSSARAKPPRCLRPWLHPPVGQEPRLLLDPHHTPFLHPESPEVEHPPPPPDRWLAGLLRPLVLPWQHPTCFARQHGSAL
mmetsp:Transcript_73927/g.130845  ORF Transcript_73927/g.130845 Transcript_73927/m.130845 type:complete len:240 (+) Transcript_73927:269-988(+)